ncbi:hypothetical protein B0H12DRAFT_619611 [Mycena haematopus]|nr:hypothetical protein B0H12DRAFT_619611 [Mycena haematopus]
MFPGRESHSYLSAGTLPLCCLVACRCSNFLVILIRVFRISHVSRSPHLQLYEVAARLGQDRTLSVRGVEYRPLVKPFNLTFSESLDQAFSIISTRSLRRNAKLSTRQPWVDSCQINEWSLRLVEIFTQSSRLEPQSLD